ncbi:MAG: deoxyribose-phosphate aldolase [Alphaproteobacteria bacterium]
MDLTSLNDNDTNQSIRHLCHQTVSEAGEVAAVCVYPEFILAAKQALKVLGADDINVATVTNFPHGLAYMDIALRETSLAVGAGADEVDLVFPYKAWLNGNKEIGSKMVAECKKICEGQAKLKVIIETGILKEPEIIREVSVACIRAGADFIKTSTGKVDVNATLEAAEVMLTAIRDENAQETCGFKAAGGVRTPQEASQYINLARSILGDDWVCPSNFRFGASSLLGGLLGYLGLKVDDTQKSGY